MDRRKFLTQTVGLAGAAASRSVFASALETVTSGSDAQVTLDPARTVAVVPRDFMGLGYEISSVARPGLLSAQNAAYVQLVRMLGAHGVLRVGGNTSDYAVYSATAKALSSPEGEAGSIVNEAVLRDLGAFLEATGWDLIWGLNLGHGTKENAIQEARAVAAAAKKRLLAFEIGNEPDLFPHREAHRRTDYSYHDYLLEYREYRDALRNAIPQSPLAGPDAADAPDWVASFASDEGKDVKLLTHHYYREGQNPTSIIDKLLRTDPKLAPMLAKLSSASLSSRVPYRICETNSFSGGGKPGVSDTLAAALWVLDFMFILASAGCAGVNMETGVNQLGFVSSYSPIGDDEHGHYWAAPEYYGMLAFAQCGKGRIIGSIVEGGGKNLSAYATYATQHGKGRTVLTLINKEPWSDAVIGIEAGASYQRGSLMRLLGSSLESKSGITLGGAGVSSAGSWKPVRIEDLNRTRRGLQVRLPAASAAIVTLQA